MVELGRDSIETSTNRITVKAQNWPTPNQCASLKIKTSSLRQKNGHARSSRGVWHKGGGNSGAQRSACYLARI